MEENKEKRQKHRIWTPIHIAEIGKHAVEHGNALLLEPWVLKYRGLKRHTASDFKLAEKKVRKMLIVTLQRL